MTTASSGTGTGAAWQCRRLSTSTAPTVSKDSVSASAKLSPRPATSTFGRKAAYPSRSPGRSPGHSRNNESGVAFLEQDRGSLRGDTQLFQPGGCKEPCRDRRSGVRKRSRGRARQPARFCLRPSNLNLSAFSPGQPQASFTHRSRRPFVLRSWRALPDVGPFPRRAAAALRRVPVAVSDFVGRSRSEAREGHKNDAGQLLSG